MHSLPEMQPPPAAPSRRAAFSLVEVALAIAIVSVAVVGILSLMSSGLGNYRQVMDTTICAQIAQRVLNDAQQADFRELTDYAQTKTKDPWFTFRAPRVQEPVTRYFDEQGLEIVPSSSSGQLEAKEKMRAIYWVNTRITPRVAIPRADKKATQSYTQNTLGNWVPNDGGTLALVTVEIACNPNGVELGFVNAPGETKDNLFDVSKSPGIRVFTYSCVVSRNE